MQLLFLIKKKTTEKVKSLLDNKQFKTTSENLVEEEEKEMNRFIMSLFKKKPSMKTYAISYIVLTLLQWYSTDSLRFITTTFHYVLSYLLQPLTIINYQSI